MDASEIYIVTCASPAARNVHGRLNENGQISIQLIVWKYMI